MAAQQLTFVVVRAILQELQRDVRHMQQEQASQLQERMRMERDVAVMCDQMTDLAHRQEEFSAGIAELNEDWMRGMVNVRTLQEHSGEFVERQIADLRGELSTQRAQIAELREELAKHQAVADRIAARPAPKVQPKAPPVQARKPCTVTVQSQGG